jgi:hypothetical protein
MLDVNSLADYIRRAAASRGIDPNVALTVARSEGLQPGTWQSNVKKDVNGFSVREPSYGPFQLLVGGPGTGFPTGLGNKFQAATGLDPSDPRNAKAGIDYALNTAATTGWGPWFGAKAAGISPFRGIQGAHPAPLESASPPTTSFPGEAPTNSNDNGPTPVWGNLMPKPAPSYQPTLGSSLANWFTGTPQEGAAIGNTLDGKNQKSPLARFFDDLKGFGKDAPQAHSQLPMPSATNGNDLLTFMSNPNPFTDFLLKQRLQGQG